MKILKKMSLFLLLSMLIISVTACSETFVNPKDDLDGGGIVDVLPEYENSDDELEIDISDSNTDLKTTYDETAITLNLLTDSVEVSAETSAIVVAGNKIYINEVGTYVLTGTYQGSVIVNVTGNVHIILSNAHITATDYAALAMFSSKKKVITLEAGTTNSLTDAAVYDLSFDDVANGALFSEKALTINGEGRLIIDSRYGHGVSVKDTLKILDATMDVTAVNHGMKGNDAVIIKGGEIKIAAGKDGIQSDKEAVDGGYVYLENTNLDIDAQNDGIQAYSLLKIESGNFTITTFNGSQNTATTEDSAKGLKSELSIVIGGGLIVIDSYDDAVHSNQALKITGGTLILSTKDDAIHAETTLLIEDGTINIVSSYEGLEASQVIIQGGTITLNASDDGINAADDSETTRGTYNKDLFILIEGGYVSVSAGGDGLDSNGTILMTGGTVIVHGPTSSQDAALDADGGVVVNGGLLIAAGSLGMVEHPATNSTQNTVSFAFSQTQNAQVTVEVKDSNNQVIVSYVPEKSYRCLVMSSEDLIIGSSYSLWIDGKSVSTFNQTSTVTYIGSGKVTNR